VSGSVKDTALALLVPSQMRTAIVAQRRALGIAALLGMLVAGAILAAAAASTRLLVFVPAAKREFPDWLRGPLADLGLRLDAHGGAVTLVVLFACYLVALWCADRIAARTAVAAIVALHVVFLLAPPLFSADVFGYIDYARLGVIHGIDPYSHGAAGAPADPAAVFVRWRDIPSPYGPVFTVASYALAHLSVATTLWIYKAVAAIAGLGCVALVWRVALLSGREPRRAAILVGLNPLWVVYGVGGAHNDLLLELLVLAAIASVLQERERAAGAQIALAALIKASAGLVLPFLLIGARRRGRTLLGASAAVAAVGVVGFAVLGDRLLGFVPQIVQQQQLVARYSVPNELGVLLGQGGVTPAIRGICSAAFVLAVVWLGLLAWRGANWIACAGWATFAALVTSAWLTPWYAVWLLPLAAIGPSRRLRAATLVFCSYVIGTRISSYLL